jgi:hypothetical protein
MALKLIEQDATTLRQAYDERKAEYDALRAAGRWSGAILYAGTLLELVLKLVICRHLGVAKLPTFFQVHDLELLLYCSGHWGHFPIGTALETNFSIIHHNWSMALRYEGGTKTQQESDRFDRALFDPSNGVITYLSQYF